MSPCLFGEKDLNWSFLQVAKKGGCLSPETKDTRYSINLFGIQ